MYLPLAGPSNQDKSETPAMGGRVSYQPLSVIGMRNAGKSYEKKD